MYAPPLFDLADAAAIRGIMRAHPFATLVSTGEDGAPCVTHLPLMHVEDGSANGHLVGHVARANPHWKLFGKAPTIAIFGGANAYISPTWYTSPDMVPTWNYQVVHAHGTPSVVAADDDALDVVVRLSAAFEASLPKPWTIDKMTPGKALGMMKGITAFTMPVARFDAKSKIGQNRTPADQRGAAEALLALGGAGNVAVGELMRRAAEARG
jgi:transcriptional regulator